jgi:hypothetical protein
MKTTTSYAAWFTAEVSRCAREGWALMARDGGFTGVYLWYKELSLVIATDRPSDEYALAEAQRVPSDRTVDQLAAWVHARAMRLPILPGDKS